MVNRSLHKKLKERGLWDAAMVMDLKSNDGSVALLDRVPSDMKALYATAFEIEPNWLIRCAAEGVPSFSVQ